MRALPERPAWLLAGALAGIASGALAVGYLLLIKRLGVELPETSGMSRVAIGVMAIGLAPFAEEIFFRGWLFTCIEDELSPGGKRWLAPLLGAFAFAAVHPPLSFVPVFLLGLVTSLLFARTRALGPCVVAHVLHNSITVFVAA